MAKTHLKGKVTSPLKDRRKHGQHQSPRDVTYLPIVSKKGNIPHRVNKKGLAQRGARRQHRHSRRA